MLRRASGGADRGSVLMLMPAAVLIVIILGAIAFDLSVVRLGEHEAHAAASAAANDAVTYGLDEEALRRDGVYRLDAARVRRAAHQSLGARDFAAELTGVRVTRIGPETVEVRVVLRVDYVFAKALPGADAMAVAATARATVERR